MVQEEIHFQDNSLPNVAQNTLHHVTDALAKLEVSKSYGSGGDAFSRKCII